MSTLQIIYVAVIFVSVTTAALLILLPLAPNRMKQRLDGLADTSAFGDKAAQAHWTRTVVNVAGKFAKLSLPAEGWENSPIRLRFLHAGYRGDGPVMLYFGAKTLLAILLPVLVYSYVLVGDANYSMSGMLAQLL